MKFHKRILICCTAVKLFCFILCFETNISTQMGLEQAIEQQLSMEQFRRQFPSKAVTGQNESPVLRRKRRYLEFPEGSSFQLVYDLIVGVVDFTNYLILGVTVALAWELPSKPPSEIFNDIRERLKDGTLGTSRNDTAESINYIDLTSNPTPTKIHYNLQPMFRPPMHFQYNPSLTPVSFYKYPSSEQSYNTNPYKSWPRERHKFYPPKLPQPFSKWTQTNKIPKFIKKGAKYPWWNLPERVRSSITLQPDIRRFDKKINYSRLQSKKKPPNGSVPNFRGARRLEHRIYPVFGKRSTSAQPLPDKNLNYTHMRYRRSGVANQQLTRLDRIHIEHHRRTRHDLYERIEMYLNGRGSHGHHCVLRALCETGQKSKEQKPGSFVGELMRAIFTMPEPLETNTGHHQQIGYKQLRYDAANALKEDCATRYSHCQDSLWSSQFVL